MIKDLIDIGNIKEDNQYAIKVIVNVDYIDKNGEEVYKELIDSIERIHELNSSVSIYTSSYVECDPLAKIPFRVIVPRERFAGLTFSENHKLKVKIVKYIKWNYNNLKSNMAPMY